MKRGLALIVPVAAVLLCAGWPTRAEELKDNGFAQRMFATAATPDKKSYACFVRQYDSAHLAQHTAQKVKAMKLLVTAEIVPEDQALNYSFSLSVKFRDRSGDFSSSGSCGHAKVSEDADGKPYLGCSVECDGGGIAVELNDDRVSTLVKLDSVAIWRDDKPDDERTHFDGGKDDRVFKLIRVPLAQCKSLVSDREEQAAMLRK